MSERDLIGRPELVIFDLFGTLIKYGVMHHPFRELLKWARDAGRRPRPDDARTLMTVDGSLPSLISALDIVAPDWLLEQIQQQIEEELASLTLYDDVAPTLSFLKERGIPFAICSNLASPYGAVIEHLLRNYQFIPFMSYQIGFIKPEPEIYRVITDAARVAPSKCLFVGDTLLADYEGPRQFGMRACHLVRGQPSNGETINSLSDILTVIG